MISRAQTLGAALLGTAVFLLFDLPLPFLFGPMSACLIGALVGLKLKGFGTISKAARTILGVAVGASLTPAVIGQVPQMAASVALIPLFVAVIGLVGVPYFHRICGFDKVTSYYAAMPGGLQDMVVFGHEAGGDIRALSLIHATRVLIIVTIAPFIIVQGFGEPLQNPIGAPAADIPIVEMGLMVVAALVGWKGAERIGMFGAAIIGPLITSAVLSLSGLIHSRPPAEAMQFAQFMIGMGIGVGYVGVTLQELRRDVLSGIGFVTFLALLAFAFGGIVVFLGLAEPLEAFLSFAPAGQAEMALLAIIAGADLGFVVVHHITRLLVVITGAPLAAKVFGADKP